MFSKTSNKSIYKRIYTKNLKSDLLPILVLLARMVKCWFYFVRTITLNLYLIHLDTPSIEHDNARQLVAYSTHYTHTIMYGHTHKRTYVNNNTS
jgi:hypothetical protein